VLSELGIAGVINASQTSYSLPEAIRRLDISVDDIPGADMASQFDKCCEFIDTNLQTGVKTGHAMILQHTHSCAQHEAVLLPQISLARPKKKFSTKLWIEECREIRFSALPGRDIQVSNDCDCLPDESWCA